METAEKAQRVREKIINTLNNIEDFTQEEIDIIWDEAMEFIETLPKDKRGNFYWNSGLECLFLFTSEAKGGE